MFRMIRRSPWILAGAAAAYLMDGENGPARRAELKQKGRTVADRAREWTRSVSSSPRPGAEAEGSLMPSVPEELAEQRAAAPLAEELSAGVEPGAAPALGARVLAESEARVTDRDGTAKEHRKSDETVDPVGPEGRAPRATRVAG